VDPRLGGHAADALRHAEVPLQVGELVGGEIAPLARAEPWSLDAREADPTEPQDGQARALAQAAHLAVAALAQRDLDPALVALEPQQAHRRRPGGAAVDLDALAQLGEGGLVHHAADLGHVGLGRALARVPEHGGEVAVVGHQQHPAGVEVEATDRDHAGPGTAHQAGDRGSTFRVAHGAHHRPRLVQHDVDLLFGDQPLAVQLDAIALRVHPRAELGHHAPAHPHAPGQDQLFCLAARGHARARQHLLQSFRLAHSASTARLGLPRKNVTSSCAR